MESLLVQSWNGLNGLQLEELKNYKGLYSDIKRKIDEHRVKRWLLNQVKWIRKLKQVVNLIESEQQLKQVIEWALRCGHYSIVNMFYHDFKLDKIVHPIGEVELYHSQAINDHHNFCRAPCFENFRGGFYNIWISKRLARLFGNKVEIFINAALFYKKHELAGRIVCSQNWNVNIDLILSEYIKNTRFLRVIHQKGFDINRVEYYQGASIQFMEYLKHNDVPLSPVQKKNLITHCAIFGDSKPDLLNYLYDNGSAIDRNTVNVAISSCRQTVLEFAKQKNIKFDFEHLELIINLILRNTTGALRYYVYDKRNPIKIINKYFDILDFVLKSRVWSKLQILLALRYYEKINERFQNRLKETRRHINNLQDETKKNRMRYFVKYSRSQYVEYSLKLKKILRFYFEK